MFSQLYALSLGGPKINQHSYQFIFMQLNKKIQSSQSPRIPFYEARILLSIGCTNYLSVIRYLLRQSSISMLRYILYFILGYTLKAEASSLNERILLLLEEYIINKSSYKNISRIFVKI
jgi:hypothetical protein